MMALGMRDPILNVSQVYFTNFPKTKDSAVTEGTGKSLSSKSKSNVVVSIDDDSHDECSVLGTH